MGLAACSEVLAEVPCILHDRWLLCDMLCRPAEDCSMSVVQVGSAGSETDEYAGENELVLDSLCYLC